MEESDSENVRFHHENVYGIRISMVRRYVPAVIHRTKFLVTPFASDMRYFAE